jgi:hypothetical protein
VRYEYPIDPITGVRPNQKFPSAAVPKGVLEDSTAIQSSSEADSLKEIARNSNGKKKSSANVAYTGAGVLCDGTEYPTPQGSYLMKLLKLCHSTKISPVQPLLDVLLDSRHGNKHAKEISESMAMVNAVWKLGQLTRTSWEELNFVNVYVLADGCVPSTSVTMCMFMPPTWQFYSIDPIMNFDTHALGAYAERIHCFRLKSQDFDLNERQHLVGVRNTDEVAAVHLGNDAELHEDSEGVNTTENHVVEDSSSVAGSSSSGKLSDVSASSKIADQTKSIGAADTPTFLSKEMPAATPNVPIEPIIPIMAIRPISPPTVDHNIVIACHSHAPLQEFWDRVPSPK